MQLSGAIGCFTRLQAFLKLEERTDPRAATQSSGKSSYSLTQPPPDPRPLEQHSAPLRTSLDIELQSLTQPIERGVTVDPSTPAVTVEDATFTAGEDVDVLSDINITVRQGTVSMVVGRVGCGKSSLLKAITGEIPMKKGRIVTSTISIAFCDQTPWLQNISIRDNIVGQSPLDEKWLASIIRACALDEDISLFPLGDLAIVGSGGVALSGGQKQRVVSEHCIKPLLPLTRLPSRL